MENCIFCKIVKGEISSAKIWEDEKVFVFLDINPLSKGHCLIIPKKHSENIFDIEEETLKEIIKTAKNLAQKMKIFLKVTGVNLVNSSGIDAEQSVPHFHFHLIPRYENDKLEMTKWWGSKSSKPSTEELEGLTEKIKKELD